MTEYRIRQGIVITEICGEYLLIAAKKARETCPYVNQVNESFAYLCKTLENWCTSEQLKQAILEVYDLSDQKAADTEIKGFLEKMQHYGYLLTREGEGK